MLTAAMWSVLAKWVLATPPLPLSWMHLLTGISLEQCVGAGSGLDSEGIRHKYNVLKQSVDHYAGDGSAKDIIAWFGGYEMVMAIGGMLRAAELE